MSEALFNSFLLHFLERHQLHYVLSSSLVLYIEGHWKAKFL